MIYAAKRAHCSVRICCRHCEEYDAAIQEAGGIDLQLLGLGRMGHIGFNERGCAHLPLSTHTSTVYGVPVVCTPVSLACGTPGVHACVQFPLSLPKPTP